MPHYKLMIKDCRDVLPASLKQLEAAMMKTIVTRIVIMLAVLVAAFMSWAGWTVFSVHQALSRYRPKVGDVVVQSIDPCGRLLRTVKGVTESKWCHCGVVDQRDGRWVVCEAVGDGVRYTPLAYFLLRGDEVDFAAYRLKDNFQRYAGGLAKCCKPYVGRPYDIQYELDDEKIYCSELVYKAYRDATKGADALGRVQRFGELNWHPYKDDVVHYHGSEGLPLDREVVTPVSLTWSEQMDKVFELRTAVSQTAKHVFAWAVRAIGAVR